MKPPYAYDRDPPRPEDCTYTFTLGERPDRLKAIALLYEFTFTETDDAKSPWLCWGKRKCGKLIGMGQGLTREEARNAARELAGKDFDRIPPQELPPIDTRRLKLA